MNVKPRVSEEFASTCLRAIGVCAATTMTTTTTPTATAMAQEAVHGSLGGSQGLSSRCQEAATVLSMFLGEYTARRLNRDFAIYII